MPIQLSERLNISRVIVGPLLAFVLVSVMLDAGGRANYPNLHIVLDTGAALLSAVLALLLWDLGSRLKHPFPHWLSITFAVTSALEVVHVLVSVEWFGALTPIAQAADSLRPATWPPSAHILPVGVALSLLLLPHRDLQEKWTRSLAMALPAFGVVLLALFNALPRYTPPGVLGITRPYLALVPLLSATVCLTAWRLRTEYRLAPGLGLAGGALFLGHVAMLYSQAPHDTQAMVAHAGKVAAYLVILLSLMQLAAADMAARVRAEAELAEANHDLERKVQLRAEELTAKEHRFQSLIENSADGIVLLSREGRVVYRSRAANLLIGAPENEPTGSSFLERIHPDDATLARETIGSIMLEPRGLRTIQLRAHHRDGTWRTFESSVTNLLDDPYVDALIVNFRDISLRLSAEQAAREGDERFREMADHIKEAFFVVDLATGQSLYISPTWADIWGRPLEQGYDPKIWFSAIHPDDRSIMAAALVAVKEGRADDSVFRVLRPDGSLRWVRGRAFPVRNSEGEVYRMVGVSEDITELRDAEQRFAQAQKMEAIGQLAGGVAHDFNNLLTVIIAETQLVQLELPPESDERESLGAVLSAADSAAGLTRQLLAFSRKQLVEPTVFNLNDAVADTSKMLRRLIGEDIRVEIKLGTDVVAIRADRGQIEQVITNLAVNARDAMPRGGSLILETALVTLDHEYAITHADVSPGVYATLIVSDTGSGMTEDVRAHAFEPFFTTKETGRGTGLGLATCHGIVKQAGGHISVYSELGVGTTVRIHLPRIQRADDVKEMAAPTIPRGNETVLFVEDEPGVRRVGARILRSLGYSVIEAGDALEALRLLTAHEGDLHLLFTDVVLPGVGGRELAERVRQARPDVRVLFASGYTDDVILQRQLIAHDVMLLQKPYTQASLSLKLREALGT